MIPNLEKLVEIAFSLPGSSTEVERLFSIINNVWTTEKGQMELSTLDAMINIRFNSKMSCIEFHNANKNNKEILLKVLDSKKYINSQSNK